MSEPQPSPKLSQSPDLRFAESDPAADKHTHFGLLYESRAEQLSVAIPFIEEGLERGERCCYAASENTEGEIRDALQATGVDVEAAIESGALWICKARELYLEDGEFSIEPMLAQMEDMTAEVTDQEGYAGLRVTAEMAWLHDSAIGLDTFLDYEANTNHVFPEIDLVGLCQYDRTRIPADVIDGIIRTHPVLTVRETVTANPYYLDPAEYHSQSPDHRSAQKLEMLEALQRRERGLRVLTDVTPTLMQADRQEITEIVVSTLRDAVQLPVAGLWLYDRNADELQLEAATGPMTTDTDAATTTDTGAEMAALADLAWKAYSTDETHSYADINETEARTGGSALRSALFVPIDGDGVLCAAAPTTDAIDATIVRVTRAIAANTEPALAQADREQRLDDQRDDLTRYAEVTRLLRRTCRTVVGAATRSEIESVICDQLTTLEDVRFTWIGAEDADGITPRAWAGSEQGYLSEGLGSDQEAAPAVRAATTDDPVVVSSIVDRVEDGQWRTAAMSRDFRSAMSVPITYDDISYGVVTIYAGRSAVFDDLLQSVLAELGQLIAHAIHLAEQTTALQEHSVQELEFTTEASNFPYLQLSRNANCPLTVEGTLSTDGDQTIVIVTVEGVSRDQITDAVDTAVTITDAELVRETAEGYRVKLTLKCQSIGVTLAKHGAVLRAVTADPSGARVVVDAPTTVDTPTIVDAVVDRYPDTNLVAKRQGDRSLATFQDLQAQLLDQLTERQLDVLTAAYNAGYFESPRKNTGEEVAETLDITSQTFSQHLRRVQRKLFDTLLADGSINRSSRD